MPYSSAEEAEEELEEGEQRVNNVVHSFRLVETSFDKKSCVFLFLHLPFHSSLTRSFFRSYMTYLKGYMKSIKAHLAEHNPERVPAFEKGAAVFAKKCVLPSSLSLQADTDPSPLRRVLSNIGDWQFFTGESMNPDGMVGTLPFSLFFIYLPSLTLSSSQSS